MLKRLFLYFFILSLLLIALFPHVKIGFFSFVIFEMMYVLYPLFLIILLPLILIFAIIRKFSKFQFWVLSLSFFSLPSILSDVYFNSLNISRFTVGYLIPWSVLLFILLLFLFFYYLNRNELFKFNFIFTVFFFTTFLLHFLGVL